MGVQEDVLLAIHVKHMDIKIAAAKKLRAHHIVQAFVHMDAVILIVKADSANQRRQPPLYLVQGTAVHGVRTDAHTPTVMEETALPHRQVLQHQHP